MIIITENSQVINCTGDFVVNVTQENVNEFHLVLSLPNFRYPITLGIFLSVKDANKQLNGLATALTSGMKTFAVNKTFCGN